MSAPSDDRVDSPVVCYRHRNRPTNVRCQNCGKPICEDCMRDSPVGYRCPDCSGSSRPVFSDDLTVTKVILGLNVAVFVLGIVLQLSSGAGSGLLTSGNADLSTDGGLIVSASLPNGDLIGVATGEWWRLITSGFLHAGILHIGLNAYFIWTFGQLLEPTLGRLRFGLLYLVGLLGGSIGAMLFSAPNSVTVGASGAAFGLLGAAIVLARLRGRGSLESNLIGLAVINFVIGFLPGFNISVGGHAGGFVVGLAAGWVLAGPLARRRPAQIAILVVAAVALFIGGIAVADMRSLFA